jgi:O-antigen/teichoic acid export membrane protein
MGLNSLLLSVLSMLSLLELGIGNAIYFSLYKPLAEKNDKMVSAIMRLYANVYKVVGALVLIIGFILLPFLHYFVETELPNSFVFKAYIIMLFDTSLSYYMAYRRNIFNADQKEYFITNVDTTINVLTVFLQMAWVVLTGNFYGYLVIKMIGTISGNLYIYFQSGRKYSYLKERIAYRLSDEFLQTFVKNVKALCVTNISTYLVFGTDNLLLSRYTNLTAVFIYSNYTAILNAVNQVFHQVFNSMQASVGNFMVLEGEDATYSLFQKIFFINFLITSYTSVALLTLYNDAISLWLGKQYTWSFWIVAVLVFNNYSRYILQAVSVFKNAAGLYSPYSAFKFLTLLEGVVNLVASLFFIVSCRMGVLGVFLGTTVSTVISTIGIPHALFRYYFKHDGLDFVKRYFLYLFLTIIYCLCSVGIYQWIRTDMLIFNLVLGLLISFIVPIGFSAIIFRKSKEFQFVWDTVVKYCMKIFGNRLK